MKRKILTLTLLLASSCFALPTDSYGSSNTTERSSLSELTDLQKRGWDNKGRKRRRNRGRNDSYYGYRNYGQYRRTQVGRRSRLVRRSYWRNGIRLSRLVRVYY